MSTQRIAGIIHVPHGTAVVSRSEVDAVHIGKKLDVEQADPHRTDWLWAIRTQDSGSHVAYARWADDAVPVKGVLTVTGVTPGKPGSGKVIEDFVGTVTPVQPDAATTGLPVPNGTP